MKYIGFNNRGQTFIEIIIYILVIGIFFLMLNLNSNYLRDFYFLMDKASLKRDLNYYRTLALYNRKNYEISLNENGYRVFLGRKLLKKKTFKGDYELENNFNNSKIYFQRSGIPGGAGTINYFLRDDSSKKIMISVTPVVGKINVK